ncbi:MAG: hypothetical protein KGH50_00825, partial [Candidatus Micrarchaeota archaeon]|nr:hypothetical protein [Candidatus Micrarchaeota archaeon]
QKQYFVNVSSAHSTVSGTGWYAAASVANYSLFSNISYYNSSSRYVFIRWSNGNPEMGGTLAVNSPANVIALWRQQYLVSATSDYGNVSGSGWYNNGSVASLSVKNPIVNLSLTEKLAFYSWSNGETNSSIKFAVNEPENVRASFKKQYLTTFKGRDAYGNPVALQGIVLGNSTISSSAFIFGNVSYDIKSVYYNNAKIAVNRQTSVNSSGTDYISLPVYNVRILTKDIFGGPIKANFDLRFSNGTEVNGSSGSGGVIAFSGVPYGSVSGTIEYLGIKQSVYTSGGAAKVVPFVSLLDIVLMIAAVAAAFLIYNHSRKRLSARAAAEGG